MDNPNNPGEIPYQTKDIMVIVPVKKGGFAVGTFDDEKDGRLDYGVALLPEGEINDANRKGILQESLSLLTGPNEVNNRLLDKLTVLSGYAPTDTLTPMDRKLLAMAQHYAPKSNLLDILG